MLESLGIETWANSERLAGGQGLTAEIQKAIVDCFLVVLSLDTSNRPDLDPADPNIHYGLAAEIIRAREAAHSTE